VVRDTRAFRSGAFATEPLRDVDASLREVESAAREIVGCRERDAAGLVGVERDNALALQRAA
jgi:hypothetical protein